MEKFVFIRPVRGKAYPAREMIIANTVESYIVFDDKSPELMTHNAFRAHLKTRLNGLLALA